MLSTRQVPSSLHPPPWPIEAVALCNPFCRWKTEARSQQRKSQDQARAWVRRAGPILLMLSGFPKAPPEHCTTFLWDPHKGLLSAPSAAGTQPGPVQRVIRADTGERRHSHLRPLTPRRSPDGEEAAQSHTQ